jgi:hypothetical protein
MKSIFYVATLRKQKAGSLKTKVEGYKCKIFDILIEHNHCRFFKVRVDSEILSLIKSRYAPKETADANCFASESITDVSGLGKSWPQMDLDPLSPTVYFFPDHSCSSPCPPALLPCG